MFVCACAIAFSPNIPEMDDLYRDLLKNWGPTNQLNLQRVGVFYLKALERLGRTASSEKSPWQVAREIQCTVELSAGCPLQVADRKAAELMFSLVAWPGRGGWRTTNIFAGSVAREGRLEDYKLHISWKFRRNPDQMIPGKSQTPCPMSL